MNTVEKLLKSETEDLKTIGEIATDTLGSEDGMCK